MSDSDQLTEAIANLCALDSGQEKLAAIIKIVTDLLGGTVPNPTEPAPVGLADEGHAHSHKKK